MFQSVLIVSLMAATLALLLLGPADATQPDVYANPVIAQRISQTGDEAGGSRAARRPASPGIDGDHPSPMSSPPPAGPVESGGMEQASGDAKPDPTEEARGNTGVDARRDPPGSVTRDAPR